MSGQKGGLLWMDRLMNGWMDAIGWIDGWMDGRTNERMDGQME